ncbi:MAG TPA: DUF6338 family protein, partial [Ktedonobacterales bacterium]|nr:DUF6338 family protein [Ktedonobacterales bacterium]
ALVGVLAAGSVRLSSKLTGASGYPCAWDDFVRKGVPNHMVAVTLQNGETYAGFLKACDVAAHRDERDLVNSEPAVYDEERHDYQALPFHQMFIPASLQYSVATIADLEHDRRIVPIGESPFKRKGGGP